MPEIEWRDTWRDDPRIDDREDYIASCDGADIGRIYSNFSAGRGTFWMWFAWFDVVPNSGTVDSRREAMLAIEDQYLRTQKKPRQP